ncbi:MAG: aminoglycoside phosphotransferase family protein [Phenylobacterium sp.]|uniref:aminoglycoside phosphotransferase family protein n=1 Tax=Phenylobacterium sp. TaxID=1871053 RepID=UPI00356905E6
MTGKMHADEVVIDEALVRRRLKAQFPQWAELPLTPVLPWGTDNAIYRLGTDMLVRMPRVEWSALQVEKEQTWLPRLSPFLPLEIPRPLGCGSASEDFPWAWSVYSWIEGAALDPGGDANLVRVAEDLGRFVAALHAIDAAGGPAAGRHNFGRGMPLATRDRPTREALDILADVLDLRAALALWEDALAAPVWSGAPVWVHGDVQAANLLMRDGRLCAVIDYGGLGVGDPACDLIVAWSLFPPAARERYRELLDVDQATWRRGRGWALSVAAIALPYYRDTNPRLVDTAERSLRALLSEPLPAGQM